MDIESALVERLNSYRVSTTQIYDLLSAYLRQPGSPRAADLINDEQVSGFAGDWLKEKYPNSEPFLCDALVSRTLSLMHATREVACALNPEKPEPEKMWSNPAFLLAASIAPFQTETGLANPLFRMKDFLEHLVLAREALEIPQTLSSGLSEVLPTSDNAR